jgi:hypothetical protein
MAYPSLEARSRRPSLTMPSTAQAGLSSTVGSRLQLANVQGSAAAARRRGRLLQPLVMPSSAGTVWHGGGFPGRHGILEMHLELWSAQPHQVRVFAFAFAFAGALELLFLAVGNWAQSMT